MDFSIKFDSLSDGRPEIAVGFGVFDGVHPGHRLIISCVAAMAAERGALPAAVTFVPHPRAVIPGMEAPPLIISVEERLQQLRAAGAALTGIIPFTPSFGAMEPESFLTSLLRSPAFALTGICVGEDWRFGCGGKGNAAMLERFCSRNGLSFKAVKRLKAGDVNISSSVIRELAGKGDLAGAAGILGRELELSGSVVKGFRVAGKELEAPTANLELDHGLIVPDGVYAGSCCREGKNFTAVLNIGMAPTYGVGRRRIEVHLIGFNGDLYGEKITVKLLGYLRPERKFSSPEELKKQITRDIAEASVIYNKFVQKGGTL
jgi:riboflavin kinase/FMN adenylyltransferase